VARDEIKESRTSQTLRAAREGTPNKTALREAGKLEKEKMRANWERTKTTSLTFFLSMETKVEEKGNRLT